MLGLLENEALIYERLKTNKDVSQIAKEIGITKGAAFALLSKLIDLDVVRRSGTRNSYAYSPKPLTYEIIKQRTRPPSNYDLSTDELITESQNIELTDDQLYYIKNNFKIMGRSQLAKNLGITKLQLNFALMRLGK